MSGATAAEWAERADATALAVRRDEIDRRALAGLPETRDALAALGVRAARELEQWRERRLARLVAEEPGVASAVRPHRAVTAGYLAASLSVAVAYALFFSRGNLGLAFEVVAAAIALAVGAGLMALVVPWSRRRPVTTGDATMSWIVAGVGAAAAIATVVQAGRAGGDLVLPVAIAAASGVALVAMAVIASTRRLRIPRSAREREAARAAEVREEFGEEVARIRRACGEQVASALAEADPDAVERARSEVVDAYAVLARRGLLDPSAAPHEPGLLLIDDPIARAARAMRVPDRRPLVPALARVR
ncbi:hypothetical protein [Agromyces sp. SYSU T00266]|uniref:hypothetical protein n=1 Tax=Agromyces zhanjiangensis TaxID=3158562 RepID=UPI003396DE63